MTMAQAAAALVDLLTGDPHRDTWEREGAARAGQALNATAVGRVLARHLVAAGRIDELEERDWPRSRRHRLANWLTGTKLHHVDLDDFADAFGISDQDRVRLHTLVDLPDGATPLTHDDLIATDDSERGYRSVAVDDHHEIGSDRRPVRHRAVHRIEALDDEVHRFWYVFDTDHAAVEVRRGGRAGPVRRRLGFWGVPIELRPPLHRGQQMTIEYVTSFSYTSPPAPEFRRRIPAEGGTDVTIAVRFAPNDVPAVTRQAVWTDLASGTAVEQDIEVDDDGVARLALTSVDGVVVGVRWAWNDTEITSAAV